MQNIDINIIDGNLHHSEVKVINALKNYFESESASYKSHDVISIGPHYINIRDQIKGILKFNDLTQTVTEKKTMSKKERIKHDNIVNNLQNTINDLKMGLTIESNRALIDSQYIEYRGLYLIKLINKLLLNQKVYNTTDIFMKDTLNVIVTCQKFIKMLENDYFVNIENKSTFIRVSVEFYNDIVEHFKVIKSTVDHSIMTIYNIAPELLVVSEYDNIIPKNTIKPRDHQIDIVNNVVKNLDRGFMTVYKSTINSGKTTNIIGLGYKVKMLKKENPLKYNNLKIIFTTCSKPVLIQVANMCYNIGLGFGIVTYDNIKNEYHINNKNSNQEPIVIIGTPDNCSLVYLDMNPDNTIVYFDEPTMGSDTENSEYLIENMKLLTCIPKNVILSSATFPDITKLTALLSTYKSIYPEAIVNNITSNDIQISCDLKNYNNNIVIPHLNIETNSELLNAIKIIEENPVLGRIYTLHACNYVYNKIRESNIARNLPTIADTFSDITNLSSNSIRGFTLNMLKEICNEENHNIKSICSSDTIQSPVMRSSFDSLVDLDNINENITFDNLGTDSAYKFSNNTLIVTDAPIDFSLKNFRNLIDIVKSSLVPYDNTYVKFDSISEELKRLDREILKYDLYIKKLESGVNKMLANNNEGKRNGKTLKHQAVDESVVGEYIQEKPYFKFPSFCEINTRAHMETFNSNISSHKFTRMPLDIKNINIRDMRCGEDLIILLLCGVGIYTEKYNIDKVYTNTVLKLANEGALAYIISDISICYGTNYPINKILIDKSFSDKSSINTIFQLIGRAGRVGKSWTAEAYVTNCVTEKLLDYVKTGIDDIEINNINKTYDSLIETKINNIKKRHEMSMKSNIANTGSSKCLLIKNKVKEVKQPEPVIVEEKKELEPVTATQKFACNKMNWKRK